MFDYSKLKKRINEMLGDSDNYAKKLGVSNVLVNEKLSGSKPFSISEMDNTILILNIPKDEIYDYFFVKKIENNSIKYEGGKEK